MPKVYVSSHDIALARQAAVACADAGHPVISTWHLGDAPMKRSHEMTDDEMRDKAKSNAHQIGAADVLLLVAAPEGERVPGGKFVEAGIAIGRGRRVVIWGRRENILLRHPSVSQADDLADAVALLGEPS